MRISDWSSDVCASDLCSGSIAAPQARHRPRCASALNSGTSSSPPSVSPHPSHADRPRTTLRPCRQRKISVARKLPIIALASAPARAITLSLLLSASGHLTPEPSHSPPPLFPAPDRTSPPAPPHIPAPP